MKFEGKEKCVLIVGKVATVMNNLDGNCDKCKYYETLGVHRYCCAAARIHSRITEYDCKLWIRAEHDPKKFCLR